MENIKEKKKVLFICTHNSARSQIAEGLMNTFLGDDYTAWSAGTEPTQVNPYAIKVMEEIGIDVVSHHSKGMESFLEQDFDYVITVCDHANETCPFFPSFTSSMITIIPESGKPEYCFPAFLNFL